MFKGMVLALAGLAASSSIASAQDHSLRSLPGTSNIWIWQSKDAHDEGMSLISAGVHKTNPAMITSLISCIVDPGTKVIITDMGFVTHDVMVVSGPDAGCRGNIPAENLGR